MTCLQLTVQRFTNGDIPCIDAQEATHWCENCRLIWDNLWGPTSLGGMVMGDILEQYPCSKEDNDD